MENGEWITDHRSPFTVYRSPFTVHRSPFTDPRVPSEPRAAASAASYTSRTGTPAVELGQGLRHAGVLRAIYTDIARDGMLSGVDAAGSAELARQTGLGIIASGGVRDLSDIRLLKKLEPHGVEGVIVGQAIYTGSLDLAEAVNGER